MKKLFTVLLTLWLVFVIGAAVVFGVNDSVCKDKGTLSVIAESNMLKMGDYAMYRVPGTVITDKGTVLAYFEGRSGVSDWSDIDIVLFRSTDGGVSYSEQQVIASAHDGAKTINNPVMITDGAVIHFLYCVEYGVEELNGGVFYRKSTDDGVSWSAPRDISEYFSLDNKNAFAIDPGHGIKTSDGRLLATCWFVPVAAGAELTSHTPSVIGTVYSEDGGESWKMGEAVPMMLSSVTEGTIAELKTGGFILNVRTNTGIRGTAYSDNGVSGWSAIAPQGDLIDPKCFGSMLTDGNGKLYFVNCADTEQRKELTVKTSVDGGKNWETLVTVEKCFCGYADLALDGKGNLIVIYESYGGVRAYSAAINIFNASPQKYFHCDMLILGVCFGGLAVMSLIGAFVVLLLMRNNPDKPIGRNPYYAKPRKLKIK